MKNHFDRIFGVFFLLVVLLFDVSAQITEPKQSSSVNIKELALKITRDGKDTQDKTKQLVTWVNTNFKWSATDYQKRTVEEILSRGEGNCAELTDVLLALLESIDIRARWIAEINIHPKSERRQNDAAKLVAEKGNRYSVFGYQHNDHRWLEVYNERRTEWFPADPAVGVVGIKDWSAIRLGFGERPPAAVPAVSNITRMMIVPFTIVALESRRGKMAENRSRYYLVEGFNQFYGGKLKKLSSWKKWESLVDKLSAVASTALFGETNLHEQAELIEEIAQTYETLRQEANRQKLVSLAAKTESK